MKAILKNISEFPVETFYGVGPEAAKALTWNAERPGMANWVVPRK